MADTPRLAMPYIEADQDSAYITHNEALALLDLMSNMTMEDRDLSAPPGSPALSSLYYVKATASGDWTGHDGEMAVYTVSGWRFFALSEGMNFWIKDEDVRVTWNGSAWIEENPAASSAEQEAYGGISAGGGKSFGTGFTVSPGAVGVYNVTFTLNPAFSSQPAIIPVIDNPAIPVGAYSVSVATKSTAGFTAHTFATVTGGAANVAWMFIARKP